MEGQWRGENKVDDKIFGLPQSGRCCTSWYWQSKTCEYRWWRDADQGRRPHADALARILGHASLIRKLESPPGTTLYRHTCQRHCKESGIPSNLRQIPMRQVLEFRMSPPPLTPYPTLSTTASNCLQLIASECGLARDWKFIAF